jgi:hypothetical protein
MQNAGWSASARELVRPADAAFLLHDYGALQPAVDHLATLPGLSWAHRHSEQDRRIRGITAPSFPDEFATWLAAMPEGVIVELGPELRAFA